MGSALAPDSFATARRAPSGGGADVAEFEWDAVLDGWLGRTTSWEREEEGAA